MESDPTSSVTDHSFSAADFTSKLLSSVNNKELIQVSTIESYIDLVYYTSLHYFTVLYYTVLQARLEKENLQYQMLQEEREARKEDRESRKADEEARRENDKRMFALMEMLLLKK